MFLLTVIGPFVWALDKSFGLPKDLLFQFTHPYGGFTLWDIIMPYGMGPFATHDQYGGGFRQ